MPGTVTLTPQAVYGLATRAVFNPYSLGNMQLVLGLGEVVIAGCDLRVPLSGKPITAVWNVWISVYDPSIGKQTTVRLRRTNILGAILKTDIVGDAGADFTSGHVQQLTDHYVDSSPDTGRYVLTIQLTAGNSLGQMWSDTRYFAIT